MNMNNLDLNEFGKNQLLPVSVRSEQCISSLMFKFFSNTSPPYMNDILKPAGY